MSDRITIRLGCLAEPLKRHVALAGATPVEYVRELIAVDLGKKVPEMKVGNPNFKPKKNKKEKQ